MTSSKKLKIQYIVKLKKRVQELHAKATSLHAEVASLERDITILEYENNELKLLSQAIDEQLDLKIGCLNREKELVKELREKVQRLYGLPTAGTDQMAKDK